jgi:Tfp pilus assembly protein PilN
MQQQINLYQPIFRRERKRFSARALLQITLLSLGLMVGIAGYFQLQLARLQASERSLSGQYQHLKASLDALRQHDGDPALMALDARIAALETSLAAKQSLLDNMTVLAGAGRDGFSPYLDALARLHLNGLWLTGVQIRDGGRVVQLRGVAMNAGLIPRYLQRLPDDPRLQDLDFRQVLISRRTDAPRQLDFTLQAGDLPSKGIL